MSNLHSRSWIVQVFVENWGGCGWFVPFTCSERGEKRRKGKEVLGLCGDRNGMLESSLMNGRVFEGFKRPVGQMSQVQLFGLLGLLRLRIWLQRKG